MNYVKYIMSFQKSEFELIDWSSVGHHIALHFFQFIVSLHPFSMLMQGSLWGK